MSTQTSEGLFLPQTAHQRVVKRLTKALGYAQRSGSAVLASATVELSQIFDPVAVTFAAAAGDETLFCIEQPSNHRTALAAIGSVYSFPAELHADRFKMVQKQWRELIAGGVIDRPAGPPGSGPVLLGGFSFSSVCDPQSHWQQLTKVSSHLPAVSFARKKDDLLMTYNAIINAGDSHTDLVNEFNRWVTRMRPSAALRSLDSNLTDVVQVVSSAPPAHYIAAVTRAREQIQAGDFEKIVLARSVQLHAAQPFDAAALFGALRAEFPDCFTYCLRRGSKVLIGASPELLVRRQGLRVSTVALAGSTRRSSDPATDADLGERLWCSSKNRAEQKIVVDRIKQTLADHALWVTAAQDPVLVRVANIQHLGTPIRAQLREPTGVIELAGMLHPTPAVGGEPYDVVKDLIPALEELDRGLYAGPIGWCDANDDGEFCVALRCALLAGNVAHCFAGVGVVAGSEPVDEFAETELKLQALIPYLTGHFK